MDFGFSAQSLSDPSALRIAELVRLQKFAQRITSTLDIEELVPRIVDEIATSLGCVEINLYLRDPQQSEFVLAGVRGCSVHGKGHCIQMGTGMVGHVASTGKMHYAPDVTRDPYYLACEPDTRSEVAIPLQRGRRTGRSFHGFASRARCFLLRSTKSAAGAVRSRRRRSPQRPPLWR
jgi:hypothetical protein